MDVNMSEGPDSRRARLTTIGERLGMELTDVDASRLLTYVDLLQRWNVTYNLTAVRDPALMLTQHLADCLAVVLPFRRVLGQRTDPPRVLDVGSGGGLPGVVLAVLNPGVEVTCVDAVGKKAAFVQQVAMQLKLPNLQSVHSRVEAMKAAPFDLITARAFSSLADFVRLTEANLKPEGAWLAMKGRLPEAEIAQLPSTVEVFHVEQIEVPDLGAERCLVWMRRSL